MKISNWMATAAVAAGLSLAAAGAHAALVPDGDFSAPYGGGTYMTLGGGTLMGPWTVTGNSVDLIGGYWQTPTGPNTGSVDLDGNNPGGITQTLTLAPGSYVLSFDLSGNPDGGDPTKVVDVSVGGASQAFSYTTGSNTHSNMMYTLETLRFTSTGSTVLSFSSGDATGSPWGPVVADVNVNSVPEPATWALMIGGLGLTGFALRRRAAKTLAA